MLIVIFDGEVKKNLLKIENFCGILQKSDVKEVRHSNVPVAQLDRVLASDAKGRGFESLRVRHKMRSLVGLFFVPEEFKPTRGFVLAPKLTNSLTRCGHLFSNLASESLRIPCLLRKLRLLR